MPLYDGILFYGYQSKMTDEQRRYVDSIIDNQLTIVDAIAGSGKTTLAVAAARHIFEHTGKPLLYILAPVQEKGMGFRPGTQEEKEAEYLVPLKDALLEINQNPDQCLALETNPDAQKSGKAWVEAKSHIFVRGSNIKGKTVIIDEAANFTRGELKKLLTRIHSDCHTVLIGHRGQNDLPDPSKSGFEPYTEHFRDEPYCEVLELTKTWRGAMAQHADKLTW